MSKEMRRKQILEIMEGTKVVTSVGLSEHFRVTEETIRKDLNYLSEKGLIMRTFGGAALEALLLVDQKPVLYPEAEDRHRSGKADMSPGFDCHGCWFHHKCIGSAD